VNFCAGVLRAQRSRPIEALGQALCSVCAGVNRPSEGDGMDSAISILNVLVLMYVRIDLLSG